jgi:Protein of unknown function (DUF1638)
MMLKPDQSFSRSAEMSDEKGMKPLLLLACGALAREIVELIELNKWQHVELQCFPAKWHNTPQFIVPALRQRIIEVGANYRKIYVLYADCGTGGLLDIALNELGVERIDGPHCYSFFSGNENFAAITQDEFNAFYLTDYLVRQFDKLIWEGLGLDRHPELLEDYFRHYEKVVYLAQVDDVHLHDRAREAARKLGLAFEYRYTGYGDLEAELRARV